MPDASEVVDALPSFVPLVVTLAVVAVALLVTRWYFLRSTAKHGTHNSFSRPIATLLVLAVGLVSIIIALPLKDGTKDQLLGLLGLVLTGVIGLSSTTIVANAMGGFMIRSIRSFRSGDFVRVGAHFGRVSARGLFHTEIQTEDRDLTTLPNLYLITNPVTVVRNSGTIISASVSLGYDTHQAKVEPLLLEAARNTGLEDPFVLVQALGDFSVSYRVAGFLGEVKLLVSKRSQLNIHVLNTLHAAGIEIMSPTAMMQRPLKDGQLIMPEQLAPKVGMKSSPEVPEARIFDKAEEAEEVERLVYERNELVKEKEKLEKELSSNESSDKATNERRIREVATKLERMEARQEALQKKSEKEASGKEEAGKG